MPHSRLLARLSCLACLLFLSACASAEAVHEMSAGKKIAVASMVGNEMNLRWVGTTVFNNEEGKQGGMNLDQAILDSAVADLKSTRRYAAVDPLPPP